MTDVKPIKSLPIIEESNLIYIVAVQVALVGLLGSMRIAQKMLASRMRILLFVGRCQNVGLRVL